MKKVTVYKKFLPEGDPGKIFVPYPLCLCVRESITHVTPFRYACNTSLILIRGKDEMQICVHGPRK